MSGIAGIIRFDGAAVEPGQIERMTAAIAHRGPDGITHWAKGPAALGHCMLRTTPESLEETQPLANEDESHVLVMDGRVDNWEELRAELLKRGAVLRTRADAELVLRAYEVWGEACPNRIIGEYVFFVWDARQQRLFGARDGAGTRHFYYHTGRGWFAFSSEIKGLLALDRIEPRLNESRVFDYLVPEFDREDVVGTFYEGILRLPAGHAMAVTESGVKTWRWWNPGELPENRFASLDECTEAFLEQLRVAVKCRLRGIGPVGAMLSGGLDSSSIVGLIRKEFRDELSQPLRTFSLVREDRENCHDSRSIQHMLEDGWIEPTILTSDVMGDLCTPFLNSIRNVDEPFAHTHGLTYYLAYNAASQNECRVVLDGMAGDQLFYSPQRSLSAVLRPGRYTLLPDVLGAYRQHGFSGAYKDLSRFAMASAAPGWMKVIYRRLRDEKAVGKDDLKLLPPDFARRLLASKRLARGPLKPGSDQAEHARYFTSGLLSFGHETYGQIAFSAGVEPRSPFSDRRLIEFAIQMPIQAKLFTPWYKPVLRESMAGTLPEPVRYRREIGGHPGWKFYERLISQIARDRDAWKCISSERSMSRWMQTSSLEQEQNQHLHHSDYLAGLRLFRFFVLSEWLASREINLGATTLM